MERLIVELNYGLGNQMFQYAFALAYKLQHPQVDVICSTYYLDHTSRQFGTTRQFGLGIFNLSLECKEMNYGYGCALYSRNWVEHILGYLYKKIHSIRWRQIHTHAWGFDPHAFDPVIHTELVRSYFQNPKYFEDIREQLLQDFTFRFKRSKKCMELEHEITQASNPVSLHIRRGDYLGCQIMELLDKDYYERAIRLIEAQAEVDKYFIFSDDIESAKRLLSWADSRYTFVESTHMDDDLYLMSICHHHIIANSTFSWWGAWLNRNEDKIVIAPRQWTRNRKTVDICPENWIRI